MSSFEITVKNISMNFDTNQVIKNLSYDFKSGYYVIKGSSGIGKTTLLRIISGLLEPSEGEVIYNNGADTKARFSFVFQEDRLIDETDAITNIKIVCPNVSYEVIKENLLKIGLGKDALNIKTSELSGGMKRRVAIVRAILSESDVLLMDEPLSGLDSTTAAGVIKYIKSNINGRLFITSSHHDLFDSFCTIVNL